jgi:hypothetical protein
MEEEAMVDYDLTTMSNRLLYQVTLASGRIITSPDSFGDEETTPAESYFRPVFSEDGRLLTVEAEAARTPADPPPVEA